MRNRINSLLFVFLGCFSLINTSNCQADEAHQYCDFTGYDAYRYASVGVGPIIFMPSVGIGYRERYAQFGWDTSLNFSTIGYIHQLGTHVVGHYYLNPLQQNSTYLGLGAMGSVILPNHKGSCYTLSPDFVFGKELARSGERRHFIEMHVGIPIFWLNSKHAGTVYFPLTYIRYGISF